jgi:uncharacterized protein (DUF302 family)
MKKIEIPLTVDEAIERIKAYLKMKQFRIFIIIDHKANAKTADLDMPDSRVILFGKPLAGTRLMQKDIYMSLDLPLKVAVVEKEHKTFLLHQTTADYTNIYRVEGHPVMENIENLFSELAKELASK